MLIMISKIKIIKLTILMSIMVHLQLNQTVFTNETGLYISDLPQIYPNSWLGNKNFELYSNVKYTIIKRMRNIFTKLENRFFRNSECNTNVLCNDFNRLNFPIEFGCWHNNVWNILPNLQITVRQRWGLPKKKSIFSRFNAKKIIILKYLTEKIKITFFLV